MGAAKMFNWLRKLADVDSCHGPHDDINADNNPPKDDLDNLKVPSYIADFGKHILSNGIVTEEECEYFWTDQKTTVTFSLHPINKKGIIELLNIAGKNNNDEIISFSIYNNRPNNFEHAQYLRECILRRLDKQLEQLLVDGMKVSKE